jgi:hypothetical protein
MPSFFDCCLHHLFLNKKLIRRITSAKGRMMETQLRNKSFQGSNVIKLNQRMYRVVFIGRNDEIVYTREFRALSDQRACNIADNMYTGLELDLWEGDRYIKNIPAERSC